MWVRGSRAAVPLKGSGACGPKRPREGHRGHTITPYPEPHAHHPVPTGTHSRKGPPDRQAFQNITPHPCEGLGLLVRVN